MRLAIAICLLCINFVNCDYWYEAQENTRDLNTERKLHRDLLHGYNIFEAPNKTMTVSVRFILKHFYFDDNEEIFTIYSFIFLTFYDHRLKWDPKDYAGIDQTQFKFYQIWMPDLKQHNTVVYGNFDEVIDTMCLCSSKGRVICVSQALTSTVCSTDLTHWPYDTQNCTFNFGVHSHHKDNLVFNFDASRGISMFGAEYGPGWNIMDFEKGENASSDIQFYMTFVLERQAESFGSITVLPSIILSILTFSSLFLDICNTRGGVALLSLLGHFYIQSFISFSIPLSSTTAPSILRFILMSSAITTFSMFLTVALSILLRRKDPPHQWIVTVNDFVLKSSMRFLIWPRWDSKKTDSTPSETNSAGQVWIHFSNIINSTSILILIIVYISIFLTHVPQPIPIDYSSL